MPPGWAEGGAMAAATPVHRKRGRPRKHPLPPPPTPDAGHEAAVAATPAERAARDLVAAAGVSSAVPALPVSVAGQTVAADAATAARPAGAATNQAALSASPAAAAAAFTIPATAECFAGAAAASSMVWRRNMGAGTPGTVAPSLPPAPASTLTAPRARGNRRKRVAPTSAPPSG